MQRNRPPSAQTISVLRALAAARADRTVPHPHSRWSEA